MKIPANTIIHYVRDNKGNPRGVIVAVKLLDGNIGISWSYCRKTDRFTKDMALQIAIGRALTSAVHMRILDAGDRAWIEFASEMPHQIARDMAKFVDRCKKYYKTEVV